MPLIWVKRPRRYRWRFIRVPVDNMLDDDDPGMPHQPYLPLTGFEGKCICDTCEPIVWWPCDLAVAHGVMPDTYRRWAGRVHTSRKQRL